jgi:hypothetical protein
MERVTERRITRLEASAGERRFRRVAEAVAEECGLSAEDLAAEAQRLYAWVVRDLGPH